MNKMQLTKQQALALAEFAGIPFTQPPQDGTTSIKCHVLHQNPPCSMELDSYLLTAEGALRVFHAAENFKVQRFLPLSRKLIYIAEASYHIARPASDGCKTCGHGAQEAHNTHHWKQGIGETAQEAILTAALQLPAVQELVNKMEVE